MSYKELLIKYIAWLDFRAGDDQLDFKVMEEHPNFWSEAELDALSEAQDDAGKLPAESLPLYPGKT